MGNGQYRGKQLRLHPQYSSHNQLTSLAPRSRTVYRRAPLGSIPTQPRLSLSTLSHHSHMVLHLRLLSRYLSTKDIRLPQKVYLQTPLRPLSSHLLRFLSKLLMLRPLR